MNEIMIESNPTNSSLVAQTLEAFLHSFGSQPMVVAAAPGRINLIGEHVDYNHGIVLPMAIDRWTIAAIGISDKDQSKFFAVDLDRTACVDLRGPARTDRGLWDAYIESVARQFVDRGKLTQSINVAVHSSIPMGAGLASSAALCVAVATALARMTSQLLDPSDISKLCREAEFKASGVPCGIMDMLILAGAHEGCAMSIDCKDESHRHISVPQDIESSLLIVNTNVQHTLADGAFGDRRRLCAQAAQKLGVASLRGCSRNQVLKASLTAEELHCALHVIDEIERARCASLQLEKDHLNAFGRLMNDSHDSLRDLLQVSCDELDCVVDTARSMDDAVYGARLTGGGFGGCVIVMCDRESTQGVCSTITNTFADRFDVHPTFLQSCPVGGAHVVEPMPLD